MRSVSIDSSPRSNYYLLMDETTFQITHAVLSQTSAHHWDAQVRQQMLCGVDARIVNIIAHNSRAISAALMYPERLAVYSAAFGEVRAREAADYALSRIHGDPELSDALNLLFPEAPGLIRKATGVRSFDTLPMILLNGNLAPALRDHGEMVKGLRRAQTILWSSLDRDRKSGVLDLRQGRDLADLYARDYGTKAQWMVEVVAAEAEAITLLPAAFTAVTTTAVTARWADERTKLAR